MGRPPGRPPKEPRLEGPNPLSGLSEQLPEQKTVEETVPRPNIVEPKKILSTEDAAQASKKAAAWKYLRGRVKRTGGWCKDLPDEEIAKCDAMLKELGRDVKDGWDTSVTIPGQDIVSHIKNQEHLDRTRKLVAAVEQAGRV